MQFPTNYFRYPGLARLRVTALICSLVAVLFAAGLHLPHDHDHVHEGVAECETCLVLGSIDCNPMSDRPKLVTAPKPHSDNLAEIQCISPGPLSCQSRGPPTLKI